MPFSQLIKLFGGVNQMFDKFYWRGSKEQKFLDRQRLPILFADLYIKETIMTINAEVIGMVKLPSVEQPTKPQLQYV